MKIAKVEAEPGALSIDVDRTALLMIDMQRDFLEPGGFGEALGNEVARLAAAVQPCRALLELARRRRMLVVHTREGHRPDLSDAPPAKVERGAPRLRIGDVGPMGRILVRGEPGHDIIEALYPRAGGARRSTSPARAPSTRRTCTRSCKTIAWRTSSSAASPPRCACTRRCARRTIAAFAVLVPRRLLRLLFPEFHEVALRMIKAQGWDLRLGHRFEARARRARVT
jgi:hypothetical protein